MVNYACTTNTKLGICKYHPKGGTRLLFCNKQLVLVIPRVREEERKINTRKQR